MSQQQQLANAVKQSMDSARSWLKTIISLVLAVLVGSTLLAMFGHSIPYVPAFKGSLQETGIYVACLAYWLKS